MSRLIVGLVTIFAFLSFTPVHAQETESAVGNTMLIVTVVLTDATIIEIPLALEVVASGDSIAITATVTQTAGLTVTAVVQSPLSITTAETQAAPLPVANRNANLRVGPGTNFAVAGNVAAGAELVIVGRSPDGKWVLLDSGAWIAVFLVDGDMSDAPVVEPTPMPTATATPRSMATPRSSATPTATIAPTVTSAPTAGPWYSGGTLHGSTLAEWQVGSEANKLATASDWYVVGRDIDNISPSDEPILRAVAEVMVLCIDELIPAAASGYSMNEKTSSLALLCATYIATDSDIADLAALLEE